MVGVCKDVSIAIDGEAFTIDLYAIDLHGYELVLGYDNSERVPMVGICKDVSIMIDDEAFTDLYAIDLHGYELVLGCDGLNTLGLVLWDFQCQSMAFWRGDHRVHWRGTTTITAPHLAATTAQDLLQLLLAEFVVMFVEPTGLPPVRTFDHHIHLQPGTPPIVMRPYWYPQLM
jgi:hypothetical protein